MKIIKDKSFFEERPLYGIKNTRIENCFFSSNSDGESAFKEAINIEILNSKFSMRYPIWHTTNFEIKNTLIDELTRAAIWYAKNGEVVNSTILGVKCLRESENIKFNDCVITSAEFGWRNNHIKVNSCQIEGEYLFFESKNIEIDNLKMKGKYSFQYVDNMTIANSILDTKDAFWHSKNVTVKNSHINGEYLGWYSKNLTLINCTIIGTQPLCYCDNLKLKDCKMINADLAFEYSEVNGNVLGKIDSIKNGKSGKVVVDEVGEIILGNSVIPCNLIIESKKIKG